MSAEEQREVERFDLGKLKEARSALFSAAVSLPFDLYQSLPDEGSLADQYVERCQHWHDNVANLYNRSVQQCSANFHPSNSNTDVIPASALIGYPPPFDDRAVLPAVPPMFVATFDDRRRQEKFVEGQIEDASLFRPERELTPAQQARHFCLDLRRRALELETWLRKAIKTFQTALLPQIELGEERPYGRRAAKVTMAGDAKPPREVRSKSAQALLSLKENGKYEFTDRKELARFNKDFPELKSHLQKVSGGRKGRPLRRISDELRALITIVKKKPQT